MRKLFKEESKTILGFWMMFLSFLRVILLRGDQSTKVKKEKGDCWAKWTEQWKEKEKELYSQVKDRVKENPRDRLDRERARVET